MDDAGYMREALRLAEKGRGWVAPNPLVGCVIVRDNRIVGRGYHRKYGAEHAETMAIRDAGALARGATMYVTLEPCNHFGKTPPCTAAVLRAGIRRLVVAARDPNPKSKCTSGLKKLAAAGIQIVTGVLAEEAKRQNEIYFHNLRFRSPFVALKLGVTLDGKIADFRGHSQWITSRAARRWVHRLRGEYAAVVVGRGTVMTDNPRLTCRVPGYPQPLRVVLDTNLSLSGRARVFAGPGRVMVFTAREPERGQSRIFHSKRIMLRTVTTDKQGWLRWSEMLQVLFDEGISSVLIEGGAKVAASALTAGVVTKLYLFVAPLILGGGISFSDQLPPRALSEAIRLKEWRCQPAGNDFLIEAYP